MSTYLNAWKIFLNGRIAQENNQFTEAINLFDQALAIDAGNESFLRAKVIAITSLTNLNRSQTFQVEEIRKRYEELGKKLSGENDDPETWISELSKLLERIEKSTSVEKLDATHAMAVVW